MRVVVVGCALVDALEVLGVEVFSAGGEHGEVGEDVVLGVAADPCSASSQLAFPLFPRVLFVVVWIPCSASFLLVVSQNVEMAG